MISIDLTLEWKAADSSLVLAVEAPNFSASSEEVAIADIMVKVFPSPISSAIIPPLGSSGGSFRKSPVSMF